MFRRRLLFLFQLPAQPQQTVFQIPHPHAPAAGADPRRRGGAGVLFPGGRGVALDHRRQQNGIEPAVADVE